MHFHRIYLGNQHKIWSKQYNGKVRHLLEEFEEILGVDYHVKLPGGNFDE